MVKGMQEKSKEKNEEQERCCGKNRGQFPSCRIKDRTATAKRGETKTG